jgi:hypothetical protein
VAVGGKVEVEGGWRRLRVRLSKKEASWGGAEVKTKIEVEAKNLPTQP